MIRLHHAPESRSMRVLWLLNELSVEFEVITHGFDASLWTEDYLEMSPVGRVPGLEIDGELIFESGAMVEILCEMFPDAGLGRAPDDAERHSWLQWVHFAETVSQHTASLTQQHIFLFEDHMRSPTVMKVEKARLGKCFEAIDRRLGGSEFLLSEFSAADIAVGQAVYMGRHFRDFSGVPHLTAWFERLQMRPAFQASVPEEGEPRLYAQDFYEAWPA